MRPNLSAAWALLAHLRASGGDHETAVVLGERALALEPANVEARYNLAVSLQALGRLIEAEHEYRAVLASDDRHLGAWVNLGACLRSRGRSRDAVRVWRSGLTRYPDSSELRFNLGCLLIQLGLWPEGWCGYEERWRVHGWSSPVAASVAPRWHEELMPGATVLVHHEQGLGDCIQFVRFLPRLIGRVAEVCFVGPAKLRTLLASAKAFATPRVRLVARAEQATPLPVDAWLPLLSVPQAIDLDTANLPADVPYVLAEQSRIERWRRRLSELVPPDPRTLRVALHWQGNPAAPADRGRSPPLEAFLPLGSLHGVKLVSVQKGHGREQLTAASRQLFAADLGPEIDTGNDSFLDTAAVLHELDLLITNDTAIAHLAGAMGRPAWVILKHVPDWRWPQEGSRTPWYPTLRLFRQPAPGDWDGAVTQLREALARLVALRRALVTAPPRQETFESALGAHREGRIVDAITGYRALLHRDPDQSSVLHLLAVATFAAGGGSPESVADALVLAERAAELAPRDPDVHANLGFLLKASGRPQDAEIVLRHALALTEGSHKAAATNLVNLLIEQGTADRAVVIAERASAASGSVDRLTLLARALHAAARLEEAADVWRRALILEPEAPSLLVAAGATFSALNDPTATDCFERAVLADPNQADALTNLGVIERSEGDPHLAIWFHRRAVAARPGHVEAWTNLGVSLLESGSIEGAQDALRSALRLRPDHADALMALGMLLLLHGRFEEGFAAYEHRRRSRHLAPPIGPVDSPELGAEDPRGLRILLIAEQGFGDTIQFVRYAHVLKQLGAREVTLGCRSPIARLLSSASGVDAVVVEGAPVPPHDVWAPLMSLPLKLGTRIETIPAPNPYLRAEPDRVAFWAERLAAAPGLRVGLVWQGNPDPRVDRGRSIPLRTLTPLAQVPGVRWISLQKGPGIEQIAQLETCFPIEVPKPGFDEGQHAFLDTAALLTNLDLLITTDTAVAHLAGALDRPVWLMLKEPPEWRWQLGRPDSPWYPKMRLFRQVAQEGASDPWQKVVAEVASELARLAAGDRSRLLPMWSAAATAGPRAAEPPRVPPSAECHAPDLVARGLAFHREGQLEHARRLYAKALALQPDNAQALHMIGVLALQENRHRRALLFFEQARRIQGWTPELASNSALALKGIGRLDEAEAQLRRAVEARPNFAEALVNLGNLLADTDRHEEAIGMFRRAIHEAPRSCAALRGLGNALRACGLIGSAVSVLEDAVASAPEDAEAHLDLAHALLSAGDLIRGFSEYEWRWRSREMRQRTLNAPRWDGRPFAGKILLVHGEQGLGDHIQLVRLLAPVARLGGRIVFECRAELHDLFRRLKPEVDDLELTVQGAPLPDHDLQVPLASLPHLLGLDLASIPAPVPYLEPDPGRRDRWKAWLTDRAGLRVGLVWQGNPSARADRGRSIPLDALAPVLETRGTMFVALQKEHGLDQLERSRFAMRVARPGPDFDKAPEAFRDTAALIAELDLVITVDTAIAHLAGALGRPTWLLLKFAPDWRWMLGRRDSPWYPTMRLYRQPVPGDWASVAAAVARDLASEVLTHGSARATAA